MNIEMNAIEFIDLSAPFSADLLVLPLFMGEKVDPNIEKRDPALYKAVVYNLEREKFGGSSTENMVITTNGTSTISKVLVIGLGPREEICELKLQEAGCTLAVKLEEHPAENVAIASWGVESEEGASHLALGLLLGAWSFDKYKSCFKGKAPSSIRFICKAPAEQRERFDHYRCLAEGITLARELTSEPANVLYPETYAKRCLSLGEMWGLQVDVFDEEQLEKLGAHALLAVGKGSSNPPRLVVLHWKGGEPGEAPIALVGKGVCYDSGGINIKSSHLVEMKWDKAGASAVVGTMYALASMKAPVNVVGIIGLVENMPDGAALKPGDIIQTLAGKSVEVIDTDNEGRLVLADCLSYAQRFNPRSIIDLGTLTLETFGALGGEYAGLFCEAELLTNELTHAGNVSGEKLWRLPLGEAFAKQIRSSVADIKNGGCPGFGESSAAAEFLRCFVNPSIPWAHLDIAGVAWVRDESPFCRQGATGFGVRVLVEWIMHPQITLTLTSSNLSSAAKR